MNKDSEIKTIGEEFCPLSQTLKWIYCQIILQFS